MTIKKVIETLLFMKRDVKEGTVQDQAIDRAVNVLRGLGTKYVNVVRCEKCVDWEAPSEKEQMDGCTIGHCRAKFCACEGQETDMTWFCADGERWCSDSFPIEGVE